MALAILSEESDGGHNWFGAPKDCGPARYTPVTPARYQAYLNARDVCGSQGVGPAQLTWKGLQSEADAEGGCHDPRINCRVGFRHLAGLIAKHGLAGGLSAYNTGSASPSPYADRVLALIAGWQKVTEN